jgi:hypothetical protein
MNDACMSARASDGEIDWDQTHDVVVVGDRPKGLLAGFTANDEVVRVRPGRDDLRHRRPSRSIGRRRLPRGTAA